jgi:hypothetical protein
MEAFGRLAKINENIEEYNELEKAMQKLLANNIKNIVQEMNEFTVLYNSKEIIQDLLDYMTVIVYNYISKEKDYRVKFINIINYIENTKIKLNSNTNYEMSIDSLLMKIWEEI